MKKILTLMTVTVLALSIVSCKKKEEPQPAPQQSTAAPSGPIIEPTAPPPGHGAPGQVPPGHEPMGQKVEFQVMVPPEVTNTWSGVKLILEDRKQNKQQELAASIGGEVKIPGSNLIVKVGPFLPDFKMNGAVITSASNDLNNPSVGVAIFENSAQVFPSSGKWGWLYARYPEIHPFQHDRFGLKLKEGIKK